MYYGSKLILKLYKTSYINCTRKNHKLIIVQFEFKVQNGGCWPHDLLLTNEHITMKKTQNSALICCYIVTKATYKL